jgi:hypothetical protein
LEPAIEVGQVTGGGGGGGGGGSMPPHPPPMVRWALRGRIEITNDNIIVNTRSFMGFLLYRLSQTGR